MRGSFVTLCKKVCDVTVEFRFGDLATGNVGEDQG